MQTKEKQALLVKLKTQGYAIRIDRWPMKETYYKPDGEALPNLPADPVSMKNYLSKGLTLVPPLQPHKSSRESVGAEESKVEVEINPLKCGICGFEAKARIGLTSHIMRKHPKFKGG